MDDVESVTPGLSDPPDDSPAVRLARSLAFALLTACEREDGTPQPYPVPMPAVVKMAEMLISHGWEQTGLAPEPALPSWLVERAREDAQTVPVEPDMSVPLQSERIVSAPKPPEDLSTVTVIG